jgi:hypothetical protein
MLGKAQLFAAMSTSIHRVARLVQRSKPAKDATLFGRE